MVQEVYVKSALEKARLEFSPAVPPLLRALTRLSLEPVEVLPVDPSVEPYFPHLKDPQLLEYRTSAEDFSRPLNIGIVFSGGPASGGHNVAAGVFDGMMQFYPKSKLIGFLGGPSGIIDNTFILLDEKKIDSVRNQGGFSLIGTGRTKIETDEQFSKCKKTCEEHQLDGLVVVGGDDSNTNAAFLAEYFLANGCKTAVVGVPKTIDGDLKNQWIETSFGFDSASKTYSEIIGNIESDALSQGKYYFFIKIMGRTASHLLLECALQTKPNFALISEEVKAKQMTLKMIVDELTALIADRSSKGKNHGVILIPEGFIEFIPEFKKMIEELKGKKDASSLSKEAKELFQSLPENIQKQFFLEADPHGNIQVSKIETERLMLALVEKELKKRGQGDKFSAQPLFLGYEGRSCLPSNFDCNYCYSLGLGAVVLAAHGKTGMMAVINHLDRPCEEWVCRGVPLVSMLKLALKKGKERPVIVQHLVDLKGPVFQQFQAKRGSWGLEDKYTNPGPIQFFGPSEITERITDTLKGDAG